MWNDVLSVFKDRLEPVIKDLKNSVTEYLQAAYLRMLAILASLVIACYSLMALVDKLAGQLDAQSPLWWTRSMTLYLVVLLISSAVLKVSITGLPRDKRLTPSSPEIPINRISQRKKTKKRKTGR